MSILQTVVYSSDVGQTEDILKATMLMISIHTFLVIDSFFMNGLQGWTRKCVWQLVSIYSHEDDVVGCTSLLLCMELC